MKLSQFSHLLASRNEIHLLCRLFKNKSHSPNQENQIPRNSISGLNLRVASVSSAGRIVFFLRVDAREVRVSCTRQDVLKRTRRWHVYVTETRGFGRWKAGAFQRGWFVRGEGAKRGQIRESREKGRDRNLLNLAVKRDSRVTARLVGLGKNRGLCYVTPLMEVRFFLGLLVFSRRGAIRAHRRRFINAESNTALMVFE